MSSPSNLYAEKVFSEHPMALWALDDKLDYISLISEEQRKQLLQYLWSRPYGEVAAIIGMLASLKDKKNDNVTPKN